MFFLNYSTIIDPILKDIRVFSLSFSGIKKGNKVLDICCGTGDQLFYYAKEGIFSFGIDLDPKMIKMAEKKKKKLGLDNVSFQVADAQNLPFENDFFDLTSISFTLHEKKNTTRKKIISEMKRTTKKGGNFIFIDFRMPLPKNLYSFFIKTVEYFAGKEHFEFFKDYLGRGGLNEIFKENKIKIEKRHLTKNGVVEIVKAINN